MANFQLSAADLLKTLTPATLATRVSFSKGRKPWLPGYRCRASAAGAARLYGVNAMPLDKGLVDGVTTLVVGAGASASGSPFTYTPAPAVSLPTGTDLTDADVLLNAIAIYYPKGDRASAQWLRRIARSASPLTDGSPWWQVASSSTITTAKGYAAANHTDWTVNDVIEIYVPAAADIDLIKTFSAAGEDVVEVMDFMAAGYSGATADVILNRVFA